MNKPLIINVGRQFGSGGKCVAVEIGNILGIPVYDNELISKAAEASGCSSDFFAEKDEKKDLFSLSSLLSTGYWNNAANWPDDGTLFRIQSKIISDIAEQESAVIIGRCADYILRDRGCTLDVFITSPLKDRVARVAERMQMTPEKAEELIVRSDRKRETYYNYFTFGNWGVASNYDLCVDSSILGIRKTAEFIVDYAKQITGE